MFTPEQFAAYLVVDGLARRSREALDETVEAVPFAPRAVRTRRATSAVLAAGARVMARGAERLTPDRAPAATTAPASAEPLPCT